MKIRFVGYVDEVIDIDEELYNEALAANQLSDFMHQYLTNVGIEIAYGREEEFNGSSV